ncbi:MAG: hypothetical protein M1838_003969 [Thelocarpon superellum]|nr:MAG: hypothetical protein M1838_003969 [Thelocarpon superellum]
MPEQECDEVHPVCGNCQRYQLSCIYEQRNSSRTPEPRSTESRRASSESEGSAALSTSSTTADPPESRRRRLLELGLLHQYTTRTSLTFLAETSSAAAEVWTGSIPRIALQYDALLYSIFSLAALHLHSTDPNNQEALDAYRQYLDLALREHRHDVTHLSEANADAACLTSSLLRMDTFTTLQQRPLHPYIPPTQWMQMTNSAGKVLKAAWRWIEGGQASNIRILLMREPLWSPLNQELFCESNREGLAHLLRRNPAEGLAEPWDAETEEAYHSTLSYLGSVRKAIAAHEAPADTCRRLMIFPLMVPPRFIDLVEEQRPRALVMLAYFFAHLTSYKNVWWVGDVGPREVHGIQSILPAEWQHLMSWPLKAMDERAVPVELLM